MTTYTYNLRAPNKYGFKQEPNTAVFQSTLTGAIQTVARPGERWEFEAQWLNLYGDEREDIIAFFTQLNGSEHRVKLPFWGRTNRGALSGTPLIDGAGQTGSTIDIDGVGIVTDWIKAGDVLTWDNGIYMATSDADAVGGSVTVPIWPSIRTSPANNDPVTVDAGSVYGTFILAAPLEVVNVPGRPIFSDLALTFVQDIVA